MWLIPSRERPHRLAKLIQACVDTKMSTDAVVLLDEDDPCLSGYKRLSLPLTWKIEIGTRAGLSEIYNKAFERHPADYWYGVLCDDAIPKTNYFDIRLIYMARNDRFVMPDGGHHKEIAPHFVIGGGLVREMGWIALPGLERLYIDTVWHNIALSRGLLRFAKDVIIEHHHFSNGLALMDSTYRKPNKEKDKEVYEQWYKNFFNPL